MAVYFANRIVSPGVAKSTPYAQAWSQHSRGGSPLLAVALSGSAVGIFNGELKTCGGMW